MAQLHVHPASEGRDAVSVAIRFVTGNELLRSSNTTADAVPTTNSSNVYDECLTLYMKGRPIQSLVGL